MAVSMIPGWYPDLQPRQHLISSRSFEELAMLKTLSVCIPLLFCLPLVAQTVGEITGEVKDSSGAVVSGATVAATNQSTNSARSAVSNDAGVYSFPALQPGIYNLKVEKQGFRTVTQNDVQ